MIGCVVDVDAGNRFGVVIFHITAVERENSLIDIGVDRHGIVDNIAGAGGRFTTATAR